MATVTAVPAESPFPLMTLPKMRSSPVLCSMVFFVCDVFVIGLTGSLVLLSKPTGGTSIAISLCGRLSESSSLSLSRPGFIPL
jgi:hypothetical protein